MDLPGQGDRVALSAQVDEPHDGVEVIEVLVLGLEDEPVVDDRVDRRVDLVGLDRNVPVEQGLPVGQRLEVQLAVDLKGRLDRDPVDRLGADVVAVDAEAQDAVGRAALDLDRGLDRVDRQRVACGMSTGNQRGARKHRDDHRHDGHSAKTSCNSQGSAPLARNDQAIRVPRLPSPEHA